MNDIREVVRDRYAKAARQMSGCCSTEQNLAVTRHGIFGASLYDGVEGANAALEGSLGCGVPTQVADLRPGEVVLDLGSGTGGDALISAARVGETGKVYGVDMTDEMLARARQNATAAGVSNVEFLKGYLEEIPLNDDTVDIALSNCVINLAVDKRIVLREAARVIKPGGRIAFSDVIAADDMPHDVREDMQQWTGCIAGALTESQFREYLSDAGFVEISITSTHAVHDYAYSAIIRARLTG